MTSKKAKRIKLIIAVTAALVLAAVIIALLFTLVNSYKFLTLSDKKINAAFDARTCDIKFIAHRGLSVEAYQNTKTAFELAAEDADAWGIETDVWVTADKGVVCMHDANSLNGIENVSDVTLEVALSTPLRKNRKERAVRFEDYLQICKGGNKVAIVEIKDRSLSTEDIDVIMSKVAASGVRAVYWSFHHSILKYIRGKDAEVELHQFTIMGLARDMADAGASVKKKIQKLIDSRINVSCDWKYLTKGLADMFHKAGLKVGVWTVNNARDIACLALEYGVDYVTTDVRKSVLFGD